LQEKQEENGGEEGQREESAALTRRRFLKAALATGFAAARWALFNQAAKKRTKGVLLSHHSSFLGTEPLFSEGELIAKY
jgi:anaerobic selenocysteine-containing dehydrogenase